MQIVSNYLPLLTENSVQPKLLARQVPTGLHSEQTRYEQDYAKHNTDEVMSRSRAQGKCTKHTGTDKEKICYKVSHSDSDSDSDRCHLLCAFNLLSLA